MEQSATIAINQARRGANGDAGALRQFTRRLRRNRIASIGLLLVLCLVLIALLAPVIALSDPIKIAPAKALLAPSLDHPFGTDQYGRDVFTRVLYGTRISLVVGFISVLIAVVVGTFLGLTSGYYGGWVDTLIMRFVDVMLAFPGILLALGLVSVLGPSLRNLMIAVGVSAIPEYSRLVRGSVLSAREHVYVEAARVVGCPDSVIMRRHVLPNVVAPVIVLATIGIGSSILWAAGLSFLGMGSQPPSPEWGRMLSEGRDFLREQWWIATFPGIAIMVTVLAMNLLGDGLRDILDPRQMRGR